MKIVVTGSRGMLGTDLVSILNKTENEIIPIGREDIDITNRDEVIEVLKKLSPDMIINCAAYTDVEGAEDNKEECGNVNVKGVQYIVDVCKKEGIIFFQISTDYVFDGKKEGCFEGDKKNPINFYGETKAKAEDYILENLEKYYIIRTSWLFGKHGKNFVNTIRRLISERDEIKVVQDQIGCPTYTKDLSAGIVNVLDKPYGIYHLTNSEPCSWYEYAKEIAKLEKSSCVVKGCSSDEYPLKAERPQHSILLNSKADNMRGWKEALRDYIQEK
ncbi:MAG: dTDP-4-dehydrorhamnose reductase [Candidatus Pacebacteria bacterium]|nr:dTDP-4-dehydrorhamnose reductase [Candidatus Paceibacterota bacterium]